MPRKSSVFFGHPKGLSPFGFQSAHVESEGANCCTRKSWSSVSTASGIIFPGGFYKSHEAGGGTVQPSRSPGVCPWPVLKMRSPPIREHHTCSSWVIQRTFAFPSGGRRVQGAAGGFGGWSLLVLTAPVAGHRITRTAKSFWTCPGGRCFGNCGWYLCGEQSSPEAVGKPPGTARCGWAGEAAAKAPGASFVSRGESQPCETDGNVAGGCSRAGISASCCVTWLWARVWHVAAQVTHRRAKLGAAGL